MRKPNGYGSIKKLSGNRRRPFVFVISKNGKQRTRQIPRHQNRHWTATEMRISIYLRSTGRLSDNKR